MAAPVVRKYKCRCLTDNKWVQTWSESVPSVCPENSGHAIDTNLTSEVGNVSGTTIAATKTQAETVPTVDRIRITTIDFEVPAGKGVTTTVPATGENIQTSVTGLTTTSTQDMVGDVLNIYFAYRRVVGVLTTGVGVGTTRVQVSPETLSMMEIGYLLSLSSSAKVSEKNPKAIEASLKPGEVVAKAVDQVNDLGQIVAIDRQSGTVTVSTPATVTFGPGTSVLLSIWAVKNFKFGAPAKYSFGERKIGGTSVPANTIVTVMYTNNNGTAKAFNMGVEYLY
jgi:hypothetical protein